MGLLNWHYKKAFQVIPIKERIYSQDIILKDSGEILPRRYWEKKQNQFEFLEKLRKKLNIQNHTDWASVGIKTIFKNGGAGILRIYGGSLRKALKANYPGL